MNIYLVGNYFQFMYIKRNTRMLTIPTLCISKKKNKMRAVRVVLFGDLFRVITDLNALFIHRKHTVLYGFVVCFYCRDLVVVTSRRLKTTWREPSKWPLCSGANGKRLSCQKLINHLNKVCSEIIGHITFRRHLSSVMIMFASDIGVVSRWP